MAKDQLKINKSEYQELVEFLGAKFDKINENFEEVNGKLDKKSDRAEVETMIGGVQSRIARLSDKIDDYRAGQIGIERQVERHEKWHRQTAAAAGIKLEN